MKSIKLSLAAALLSVGASSVSADFLSEIETSANVSLTSNYVWRGMTQTDDNPAIQGGFDLGYKGFYTGVWASNIDFGDGVDSSVEIDVYAGYANEIMGISYDIGYCQYTYPGETEDLNFGEVSIALGYDFDVLSVGVKYYAGVDTNDADNSADDWKPQAGYELSTSVPLPWDLTADAMFGQYNHTGDYYSVGMTKSFERFDISVAYTGMDFDDSHGGVDGDGTEGNFVATLSASF
jgi:uncharacterized protein (TIGR02001 family)